MCVLCHQQPLTCFLFTPTGARSDRQAPVVPFMAFRASVHSFSFNSIYFNLTCKLRFFLFRLNNSRWSSGGRRKWDVRLSFFFFCSKLWIAEDRSGCNEKQPLEFLLVKIPILLFFSFPSVFRLEDMITSTSIYGRLLFNFYLSSCICHILNQNTFFAAFYFLVLCMHVSFSKVIINWSQKDASVAKCV